MKRYALIFLVAIFLPSLVLGWLALRTAGDQRVLIERQAIDLHQAETDAIATSLRLRVEEEQRAFAEIVRALVASRGVEALAESFGPEMIVAGKNGGVAFAIDPQGAIAYPPASQRSDAQADDSLLKDNAAFISNQAPAEVYAPQQQTLQPKEAQSKREKSSRDSSFDISSQWSRNTAPQKAAPNRQAAQTQKLSLETSDFQTAVSSQAQGILSRFVGSELQLIFWTRPDPSSKWLFGLILGSREINAFAQGLLPDGDYAGTRLAILNEMARPVALSPEGFSENWRRPFVASEIGDLLPRWEVALYLANPDQLANSAQLVGLTLVLLIALALAAILAGGYFVAADTRRQLALARQRTDFVSNVSHELKTPLTSIRMFAELLAEDRVTDPAKRSHFLRIIAAESNRLTRLVNNVLNFARMERNRKSYDRKEIDALSVVDSVWETEAIRLQQAGFETTRDEPILPCSLVTDPDAISQILVNLISNAEKYSGDCKEIALDITRTATELRIAISDRGHGVPPGMEKKIFEPFVRGDDSLASEVQGSGLGLTLARRMARDLGGDITYRPREGGGSIFTLHLPLPKP